MSENWTWVCSITSICLLLAFLAVTVSQCSDKQTKDYYQAQKSCGETGGSWIIRGQNSAYCIRLAK